MVGVSLRKISYLFLTLLLGLSFAANAQYREITPENSNLDIPYENSQNFDTMVVKNTFKDSNQRLDAIVGKSQIVNFDIPVKRISIADPTLADIVILTSKQLMINGKKPGSTSLIFWSDSSSPVFYNLNVQQNADEFIKAVEYIAPNEDISIIFNDNGAVLSGKVSTSATRKKIQDLANAYKINLVDMSESATKQVLLEVKVAEVSKNFSRNLGTGFSIGNNSKYTQAGGDDGTDI